MRWVAMLLAMPLILSASTPARGEVQPLIVGVNRMSYRVTSRKLLEVRVTVAPLPADSLVRSTVWGAYESLPAETQVRQLEIRLADTTVWVPRSAYADLGNPRWVKLQPYAKGLCFTLNGGDGITGYDAYFFIEHGALRRRRVEMGEFPKESWEETTYAWPAVLVRETTVP